MERIRQQTAAVLDELIARTGEFELTDPSPALERYRRRLRKNAHKVLVVGEARRGKSTFANAPSARDTGPTDTATSQVFSICPSKWEILQEDLPRYGSRTMADAEPVPTPEEIGHRTEEESVIILLCKHHADPSALRGVGEFECAARPSDGFLGQRPPIRVMSRLSWRKLFIKLLEKFRENYLRGFCALQFTDMVVVADK